MSAASDPAWITFRTRIIDMLDELAPERFSYLSAEKFIHACPVCGAGLPEYLVVRFHSRAPRATIRCSLGCPDGEIAAALGLEVVS